MLVLSSPSTGAILRVDDDASPNGDGSDWDADHAFRYLADAIGAAVSGDEIRVAGGVYWPDFADDTTLGITPGDRAASFEVKPGVKIRGGFRGANTQAQDPNDQDPLQFMTVLTGDIGEIDDASDNSFHVVICHDVADPAPETRLEGFVIEHGYAYGADEDFTCEGIPTLYEDGGAGLHCFAVDFLNVRDCTFRHNHAPLGGAIRLLCSNPNIVNCVFERNAASKEADAAAIDTEDEEFCDDVRSLAAAIDEEFGNGGAVHITFGSAPHFYDCRFQCNLAGHAGGAISAQRTSEPDLVNCVFFNNAVGRWGGGMRAGTDTGAAVLNCTFAGNFANEHGGGFSLALIDGGPAPRNTTLTNCILRGNEVPSCEEEVNPPCLNAPCGSQVAVIGHAGFQTAEFNYCDVEGGLAEMTDCDGAVEWAVGNFDLDPQFVDEEAGDLRVSYASPCVNSADPTGFPVDTFDVDRDANTAEALPDANLEERKVNYGCLDIGAFENQVAESCPGDIAGGTYGEPDGTVGGADYAVVLGAWGTPGGIADVTDDSGSSACGDNVVDAYDLAFIFASWGTCPSSVSSSTMSSGSVGTTPADLVESMGFESIQEFADWLADLGPEYAKEWLDLMLG